MTLSYFSLWRSLLGLYDGREAQAVVRMVLEERYGLSLADIVCGATERLSQKQQEDLLAVMRRLRDGEPVQYVLGHAWFCGRRFHVGPGVLIPRPETEGLCKLIIQSFKPKSPSPNPKSQISNLKTQNSKLKVLDIGTGSGCIAVTLALDISNAEVTAIDISDEALLVARRNAAELGACVSFCRHDILLPSPLVGEGGSRLGSFDIIVSNPPYVTLGERNEMSRNVLEHEPDMALFVPDDDPLLFYRAIGRFAVENLAPDGSLYFEINPLFADSLSAMLRSFGFSEISIISDDFGKRRYIIASMKWQGTN